MKHKKLLIVLAVIVVMAVAAAVAYAWWSTTVPVTGNSISTGGISIETSGLPIDASGLVPQEDPPIGAADAAYADVTYFYVGNESSMPLMFYGWLSDGDDPNNLNPWIKARVWLLGSSTPTPVDGWTGLPTDWVDTFQPAAGGPFLSFEGSLSQLWTDPAAQGRNYLSSRYWDGSAWHRTLINPDEYGVYRLAIWLDKDAPDSTQNSTIQFTINWTGMQEEAWDDAGYDLIDKF